MTHHHGALPKAFCLCLVFAALVGCSPKEDPAAEKVNPETMETQEQAKTAQEPDSLPQEFSPDLTEQPAEDDAFFADAAFLGNSLIDGFQLYSGLTTSDYYCATSMTVSKSEELISQMAQKQYGKVYILLGTNSMATLTDEAFLKYYNDFLDFLLPQLPQDTVYYIQGIPPVSAEKMAGDENFSVERIRGLNESLAKIAYDRDLHYLDLFSALADENGALRADIASGSIHLNNEGYNVWREFLVTHTAYSKENPYLPGSPYYTAPAA